MVHTAGGRVRDEKRRGKDNSSPPIAYPSIHRVGTTFYTKYAVYANATLACRRGAPKPAIELDAVALGDESTS